MAKFPCGGSKKRKIKKRKKNPQTQQQENLPPTSETARIKIGLPWRN